MSQSKKYDELIEILRQRRSVRKYKSDEIPLEDIKRMVSSAVLAPSPGNSANRRFIAIFSKNLKAALKAAVDEKISYIASRINSAKARSEFIRYSGYYTFFAEAPVVFAVVMKPYDSLVRRIMKIYKISDVPSSTANVQGVAAAIENLLLAATALGYGACWMTGPLIARVELEKILGIDQPEELAALVPVGKPSVEGENGMSLRRSRDIPLTEFSDEILKIIR